MAISKPSLRILLLQMRKNIEVAQIEYDNFLFHCMIDPHELTSLNLYHQPHFSSDILNSYDAFFVGGLSDDPVGHIDISSYQYPFLDSLKGLLDYAVKIKKPGLLSCGGFMIGTVLLGGRITMDERMGEMDILPINFTGSVVSDPLLSGMPGMINIVSGHQKSASVLPPDSTLLASSDKCPIHAYRLNSAPIYAFQGHPELTGPQIKARVSPYKEKYFKSDEDYDRFVESNLDTGQSNLLLSQFISKVKNGLLS